MEDLHPRCWVTDVLLHDGRMYALCGAVRQPTPEESARGLLWVVLGYRLIRIDNPADRPTEWRATTVLPLSRVAGYEILWIVGPPPGGRTQFAYIYAHRAGPDSAGQEPVIALRFALDDLEAGSQVRLDYLGRDGAWYPSRALFQGPRPLELFRTKSNGMYANWHSDLARWIMVIDDPTSFPGARVFVYTSPTEVGPWAPTRGVADFAVPELHPPPPAPNPEAFPVCYAFSEQPQLRTATEIVFTYACNWLDSDVLPRPEDLSFFRPKSAALSIAGLL